VPNHPPTKIDAILARAASPGNPFTVLVERQSGRLIYYQKNPTTAGARCIHQVTPPRAFGLLGTNYLSARVDRMAPSPALADCDLNLV